MGSMVGLDRLHFMIFLVVFTWIFVCVVDGKVHYHHFILKEKNFTRLCVTKTMLVVNRQFPGPTLHVRKGDTMLVNVQNEGNYGVTLHWHGVKQPRNPWSDGPEYITQCPIQPGANFTYEVIFSTEEGTLWWHAHSDWTRNSVHGAIVVYPAQGTTYPFPTPYGDQVLILGSWFNSVVNVLVEEDLKSGVDLPTSNAYLINGQPGHFMPCSHSGSIFRWIVDHGKTYLLRLVNVAMNAELFFKIAQHDLTVVGMDGDYLKPFVTSHIMISPGQTIDVLVTTNQSSLNRYYIATRYFKSVLVPDFDYTNATAIVQYNGYNKENTSFPIFPHSLPLYEDYTSAYGFLRRLRSLANDAYPVDVPVNITTSMFVTTSVNLYKHVDNDTIHVSYSSSVNNVSWVDPGIDVLQAYYRNISEVYTTDFPSKPPTFFNFTAEALGSNTTQSLRGTKVKILNYNEQVEMVIQGTNVLNASEDHPMHLHGYSFFLVGFGVGVFDPVLDPLQYNLVDPPLVNTATAPRNGWVAVRFKANNPGVWFWHCHLERHMTWGMNSVFIVRNGGSPNSTMRNPPPNMPSCTIPSSITLPPKSSTSFEKAI